MFTNPVGKRTRIKFRIFTVLIYSNNRHITTFAELHLEEGLLDGLDAMGFHKATPVQEQVIPIILAGKDVVASAQTGTGKTAAYILPILHRLVNTDHRFLNTLILAPTRELALQIDQQIEGLAYFVRASSIAIYGGGDGHAFEQQSRALREGADIIVATPGRLIALLASGTINLKHLQHLVLDEADRMLDMGFVDDIMKIISYLPPTRQTLMFSATMPPKIRQLASRLLKDPEEVSISISKPAAGINQVAYVVYDPQKEPLVLDILKNASYDSVILFAGTKDKVKLLERSFRKAGLSVKAFHSDLDQSTRESILRDFKNREIRILIGTDILSRGIDVEGISLVINFDCPPDPEDYVHRIGRTARAASQGTAITLINEKDQPRFARIERLIERTLDKTPLPTFLGNGPEYFPKKRSNSTHRPSEAVTPKPAGGKPWFKKKHPR